MLNPRHVWNGLATFAGLSLPALLMVVPNAFAKPEGIGRPALEQAGDPAVGPHSTGDPAATVTVPASGFQWSVALVVVLIVLAVLATVFVSNHAASRRATRLAAR